MHDRMVQILVWRSSIAPSTRLNFGYQDSISSIVLIPFLRFAAWSTATHKQPFLIISGGPRSTIRGGTVSLQDAKRRVNWLAIAITPTSYRLQDTTTAQNARNSTQEKLPGISAFYIPFTPLLRSRNRRRRGLCLTVSRPVSVSVSLIGYADCISSPDFRNQTHPL